MARPIKEGLDYFPHDTDAVNDEKIEALRALYGNNGYAFYFILLERIYRTNEAELDVSDAETIQILSRKVAVTTEEFMQILETAFKWRCFDREAYEKRGVLTSNGVKKRASVVVEKRVTMREKYHKQKDDVSDAETGEETQKKPDKEKKRKEKKSKAIIYRTIQHLPLSTEEYNKLCTQYGKPAVDDVLDRMANYGNLKKYKSAYLTANNWLKPKEPAKPSLQDKPIFAAGYKTPAEIKEEQARREKEDREAGRL